MAQTLSFYLVTVIILWGLTTPQPCAGCPSAGGCSSCIVRQMKTGCPGCVPMMECMARCLWGGASRSSCTKKCDCGAGRYPRLADCKKCLAQCKCNCSVSA